MKGIKPFVLMILDGWGLSDRVEGNAVAQADTVNFARVSREYPHTSLRASGEAVGLPPGQMGNSEVGHLNLGAGRLVPQELTMINRAIGEGSFFNNSALRAIFTYALREKKPLHLLGLLSAGGVHSHLQHLFALLEMAKRFGLSRLYVHAFLDGRDVPPRSAGEYLGALEEKFQELQVGELATVMGRYYAMDRDLRWERTELAYRTLVYGEGQRAQSPLAALRGSYRQGISDEFFHPTIIVDKEGQPRSLIQSDDAVIFYNFRPDRARQLTRAFIENDFIGFQRGPALVRDSFVCFTQYDKTFPVPAAFSIADLPNTLGAVISQRGLRQLRIAETEKYAHVTFFFNGGREVPFAGESRRLIASPPVTTYDEQPQMSAHEITRAVLKEIADYDFIVLNYANPDMLGHTGNLPAAIEAVAVTDQCLGLISRRIEKLGGTLLITADHGNAEQMIDPIKGGPHTAHTTNPVPLILVSPLAQGFSLAPGRKLADVAPTILELMEIDRPKEMSGKSLLVRI